MASDIIRWRRSGLLGLILAACRMVDALSNAYCSNQNTGGALALQSIYMSMGKCYDTCSANFAFAVVQDENCWCSDYVPANQVDADNCNTKCPGFPDDLCGNSADGLFGYVQLNKQPAGTATGSSSGARSSPTKSAPTPVVSVQVITVSGSQVTQTVTNLPTSGSSALLGTNKSSKTSPGVIAAAVIAAVVGLLIIGALVFFFLRRRRQAREEDASNEKFGALSDKQSPANLNRNASTHSKAGLLERAFPPTITTRYSSHNGADLSSSDAISPVTPTNSERRQSRLVMYDQRLNPNALMVIDNGSHTSINTIEDNRDYGRMLKITNPDENGGRPSIS